MSTTEEPNVDDQARDLWSRGEHQRVATLLLHEYGREILGFLITRLRDRQAAEEAFAVFAEALWRSIASFRWQCSARVYCYALARNTASRHLRQTRRQAAHTVPLSQAGPLSELVERIRTETALLDRTETKHRLAELREQLPVDDQTLLILRVGRKLQWTEIARIVLHDDDATPTETELKADAARLRKRFQLAKEKLRKMAAAAGLLDSDPVPPSVPPDKNPA